MPTPQDLKSIGEEVQRLIESKGIPAHLFTLNIRISHEEHERIKGDLAGTKVDIGTSYTVGTSKWAISVSFPFLKLKSVDHNE